MLKQRKEQSSLLFHRTLFVKRRSTESLAINGQRPRENAFDDEQLIFFMTEEKQSLKERAREWKKRPMFDLAS